VKTVTKDYIITSPQRKGGSILTIGGKLFWPMDARPEEVDIKDIAHALSNMCRFAGHIKKFYSVAQHCVLVSDLISKVALKDDANFISAPSLREMRLTSWKKLALLHDATEAYLVDIPRPVKAYFPEYKKVESKLHIVLAQAFNVGYGYKFGTFFEHPIVKKADNIALTIEANNLVNDPKKLWCEEARFTVKEYSKYKLIPMTPSQAERAFLKRYYEVTRRGL